MNGAKSESSIAGHFRFHASAEGKESIAEVIKSCLQNRPDIIFSYLHGSFINANRFRDIDIAVFLKEFLSPPLLHFFLDLQLPFYYSQFSQKRVLMKVSGLVEKNGEN